METNTLLAEQQRLLDKLQQLEPGSEEYGKVAAEFIKLRKLMEELDQGEFNRVTKELEFERDDIMSKRKLWTNVAYLGGNLAMVITTIFAEETRCITSKALGLIGKFRPNN